MRIYRQLKIVGQVDDFFGAIGELVALITHALPRGSVASTISITLIHRCASLLDHGASVLRVVAL